MQAQTRARSHFMHTTAAIPPIYYLPAKHTDKTAALHEQQRDAAERQLEESAMEQDLEMVRLQDELRDLRERADSVLALRRQQVIASRVQRLAVYVSHCFMCMARI